MRVSKPIFIPISFMDGFDFYRERMRDGITRHIHDDIVTRTVTPIAQADSYLFARVHPALAEKIKRLVQICHEKGLNVVVNEGYRDAKRQNELYRQGGITKAKAYRSWHNYGLAVDVAFDGGAGKPSWDDRWDWQKLGEIGKSLGLEWGGDFRSIRDLGHFEFHPGLTLDQAERILKTRGINAVWDRVDERVN